MEEFEIAKTKEEREADIQRIADFLRRNGIKETWNITGILKRKDTDFGIDNDFPNLNERDESKRNSLFTQRKLLIGKYERLREQLLPLLTLERNMWAQLNDLNKEICEIEGHRLSEKVETEYDDDGLSRAVGYYRTCLVCGKRIYKEGLKEKDVVVKGEEGPKRILYR
ncbi:MAG: hypothetical protein IKR57_06450 [Bacilli bacterium]|nr:hypothetical protein [Bacilli bacterium]